MSTMVVFMGPKALATFDVPRSRTMLQGDIQFNYSPLKERAVVIVDGSLDDFESPVQVIDTMTGIPENSYIRSGK